MSFKRTTSFLFLAENARFFLNDGYIFIMFVGLLLKCMFPYIRQIFGDEKCKLPYFRLINHKITCYQNGRVKKISSWWITVSVAFLVVQQRWPCIYNACVAICICSQAFYTSFYNPHSIVAVEYLFTVAYILSLLFTWVDLIMNNCSMHDRYITIVVLMMTVPIHALFFPRSSH